MARKKLLPQEIKDLNLLIDERIQDTLDLLPHRTLVWRAFIRGVFAGLGGVIGATLMVGLLAWLLHALGGLPVIGHYLNGVQQTIQQK